MVGATARPANFRLTVLNPGGRDPAQQFPAGAGEAGPGHAPVNFHAFAACTSGSFQRDIRAALAEKTPVLLLLRGDFKEAERALAALKKAGRVVALALKETGLHQIAQQLRRPDRLQRWQRLLRAADGYVATTPEAAAFVENCLPQEKRDRVAFIPTPYPVSDDRWNFSRPARERTGILVGTREWEVPSRNHLAALVLARATGERVTVFNFDGRSGAKLLAALDFPADRLRVLTRRFRYADYLREVGHHKIVVQLDSSFVPGQVAGDALLCRMPCLGGNGAVDRIAFPDLCAPARAPGELLALAVRLLQDEAFAAETVADSQRRAKAELSFAAGAARLREFFNRLGA